MTERTLPRVAVFDVDLPPGVAFVRSLGGRGVPVVAYSSRKSSAGMYSRYVAARRPCPPVYGSDEFIDWLVDEIALDRFDLIALTSDYVAFSVMEAFDRLGLDRGAHPEADRVHACLFKDEFAAAMKSVGFPTPATATPQSVAEALIEAEGMGYPVALKPRSHIGVGRARGTIAHNPTELREQFRCYELHGSEVASAQRGPNLGFPLVQKYLDGDDHDVVSVTGCLAPDGELLSVAYSRKASDWGIRLGVATRFEQMPPPAFADAALGAVQHVLGAGVFELEVLVRRETGEYWAIDLNPRGFGQIAFDIASGNDLPALWYESSTGYSLPPPRPRRRRRPEYWHQGVPVYGSAAVRLALGPGRRSIAARLLRDLRVPHVGPVADWRDPLPVLLFVWQFVRHPRALILASHHARHAV